MWRVDDRCRLGPQRRDGRPLPDHPESTCRAVSLRGNHEVCGTHSFFTQVDGVSIPSGALGFKRSTTGAQKGSRPAVTVRAHNGRTRRRNRLPRVSRSRPAPVRPSLPARGARPTGRRRPALAGLSAGPVARAGRSHRPGRSARTAAAAPARRAAARGVAAPAARVTAPAGVAAVMAAPAAPVVVATAPAPAGRRAAPVRAAPRPPAGAAGRRGRRTLAPPATAARAAARLRGGQDDERHQYEEPHPDHDCHPPPSFRDRGPPWPAWEGDAPHRPAPKHT